MNGKYALALILALQVSMSLCDTAPPSAEVLQKYTEFRDAGIKIGHDLVTKIETLFAERVGDTEHGQAVKVVAENIKNHAMFQDMLNFFRAAATELTPQREQIRDYILGLYERNRSKEVAEFMDSVINFVKTYVDPAAQ